MDDDFGIVFIDDGERNNVVYDLFETKVTTDGYEDYLYEGGSEVQTFSYLHYDEDGFYSKALAAAREYSSLSQA